MHNTTPPPGAKLPTTTQLIRSTIIAAVSGVAILVTVILPAEYAIDPTGVGDVLGLQEMGEIRQQLEQEAAEDEHHSALPTTPRPQKERVDEWLSKIAGLLIPAAAAQTPDTGWTDEVTFTLTPGEGTEVKLTMKEGGIATYAWTAENGRINYDLHAHAGGQNAAYGKGRGKTEDAGSFTAEFDGDHGWFFRNRDQQNVTVTLRLSGQYSAVVR